MRFITMFTLAAVLTSFTYAQQMPQPTEAHKRLMEDEGTWTGTMKMKIPGVDEPQEFPIKEVNKAMAGGLWMLSSFDAGPFKGHGQFGYDTATKKYIGTWVDNSTTYLSVMEGEYDKEKHEMVMTFKSRDHQSGKIVEMKSIGKRIDKNKRLFTMMSKQNGQWTKVFTIDYQRAK